MNRPEPEGIGPTYADGAPPAERVSPSREPRRGRISKLLLPLLVLVGGIGVLVVQLVGKAEEAKRLAQRLTDAQGQVAQLETRNQELMQQIGNLQAERKGLDERVASLRTQLQSVTTEIEQSRATLQDAQDRYDQLTAQFNAERLQLQSHVTQVTSERDETREQVRRLQESRADLDRSLTRWRERYALLDRDYRKLNEQVAAQKDAPHPGLNVVSSVGPATASNQTAGEAAAVSTIPGTVELPPIIVRKDQAGMASVVRGRVLEVNELHNFVVVDRGSMDGVRIGMTFDILRGSGPVGRATVVRVRPQLSACDILRAKTSGPIQVGDQAVQSGP